MQERLLNYIESPKQNDDLFKSIDTSIWNENELVTVQELNQEVLRICYRVGLVGITKSFHGTVQWAFNGHLLQESDNLDELTFFVHPAFWEVLAIDTS